VYERVEQRKESAVTTGGEFHSHPDAHRHASVVDDMQGRHLLVLFPEYEKQRVEKFGEFRNIVPPARLSHS